MTERFEQWIGREYRHAATAMLRSVSPRAIVKERPGFGQTIRPVAGSVVASPVPASWDPDPDYFFHWFRDSAIVIDAVRMLYEAAHLGAEAVTHFADFVRFSLSLKALDGRALEAHSQHHRRVLVIYGRRQFFHGADFFRLCLALLNPCLQFFSAKRPIGSLSHFLPSRRQALSQSLPKVRPHHQARPEQRDADKPGLKRDVLELPD